MAMGTGILITILALSILIIISPSNARANVPAEHAVHSQKPASIPPAKPLLQTNLSIVKSAQTAASADGSTVYSGGWVTYTLTVNADDTGTDIKTVQIVDEWSPTNTLTSIECFSANPDVPPCTIETITKTIGVSDTFENYSSH